ncbi:hypothetical protein AWC20_07795 [Mycobacterium parmense]|nr:hypothetical protein AWC20_07795 [Mycobacterium parmense]
MWDEASVPLYERGVRLSWLIELVRSLLWDANSAHREGIEYERQRSEFQKRASFYDDEVPPWRPVPEEVRFTTRDFMANWILHKTAPVRGPLYALVPDDARGLPGRFVSHSWSSYLYLEGSGQEPFGMLNAIGSGVAGVKEEFVWLDICCYNQHSDIQVAPDMYTVIESIGAIAFPVTTEPLFDRTWCLWELLCAAKTSADIQFCAAPGYRTDKRVIVNNFFDAFDSVRSASATKEEDRQAILGEVEKHFGSFDEADAYIEDVLNRGLGNPWFEKYK